MEGFALAPQARAMQGGQSVSKTSVNVLLSTVSTYAQFLNFMLPTPHLTESECVTSGSDLRSTRNTDM